LENADVLDKVEALLKEKMKPDTEQPQTEGDLVVDEDGVVIE